MRWISWTHLCVTSCDVLGFSLGGMVAQQMALERPSLVHRMILVATAPRGGDDIMHLEKPSLAKHLGDPTLKGFAVLQKIFFAASPSSQAAGGAFIERPRPTQGGPRHTIGSRCRGCSNRSIPRVGATGCGQLRRSEWHPAADARRERHPRRDDSGLELVSSGRTPPERRTSRVSGRRTWRPVPVPRVVHPARGRLSHVGLAVRTVLNRSEAVSISRPAATRPPRQACGPTRHAV